MNEELEPPREPVELLKQQADRLMEVARWDEAIYVLNEALAIAPDDSWVLMNLAVAHCESGQLRTATDCYLEAARLDPSKDLPRSNLKATADEYVKGPGATSKNASKIFDNPRLLILLFRLWLILAAVGGISMKLFWNSVVQTINRTGPMIVPIAVVFVIALTFLIAGFFASRQRRFESLPETVKTFVKSDQSSRARSVVR